MDSVNFGFRPLKSFCAPSFFRSLDCHSFLGGGGSCRRQGKSAAPRGRRARGGGFDMDLRDRRNETEREGAGGCPGSSPRPPGAPLEPARSKWGFGGDEKERFVCTTAPLFVFGVLMQAKRSFSSLQSWILPTRQMGARKGRKGAFRLHHSTSSFFLRSHAGET